MTGVPRLPTSKQVVANLERDKSNLRHNQEILNTLAQQQTHDEIHYRKEDRPWEIVPQYMRRRVVDLVGILTSAHRMEMEQTIERMRTICDVELHVVVVPTVGYVKPRVFAQSIFFDWQIGEPRGNGLLIVFSQGDATVQMIASPAIQEHFGDEVLKVLVADVLSPMLKEGKSSLALVHVTYALAQYSQEARALWENSLLPLPVKNKVRFAQRVAMYGAINTWSFYVCLVLTLAMAALWNRILDLYCPDCGAMMHKVVDDETLEKNLTHGQWLEHKNECTQFRVHKCPDCKATRVLVVARDLFQNNKCLKCEDCDYHTVSLDKTVERLPSRTEDGLKRLLYTCENCRVVKDVALPLFRPLDDKPQDQWYYTMLQRAGNPMGEKANRKLV
jgi:uncharacterized membrane protein YgcG